MNASISQETIETQSRPDDASEVGRTSSRKAANFPIESIYGIGKRYSEALRGIGVETIGDVASITDIDEFEKPLGIPGPCSARFDFEPSPT